MAKKLKRIQFDLSDQELLILTELMDYFGSTTKANLIRKALRLLAFYAKEAKAGNEIQISGDDGIKKVFIL